ncbi:MAG: Fe-S cluster assembly ATPase SufC [Puniceicoccales bacterium]|jgi:Fe-S cluster assembly ATP-binding protein|nr:Fe-S cluster assembly ATPase SufC [Puniceicoccales bacterium]
MGNSLSLIDVSVAGGGKTILDAIDLELRGGQLVALMGPNGAGKSSLLKAISGHPDCCATSGKILLNGEEIGSCTPEERSRRGIFLAFQNPVELPGVTVAQLLKSARQMRLQKDENFDVLGFYDELHGALDGMGMDRSWANRCVNEGFSGGEKKRCELLQIIMLKPAFILLDEIDSGLDVDGIRLVADVLTDLIARGTGILLVTHQGKLLESLHVDNVAVLEKGKISRCGGLELAREIERSGDRKSVV